MKLIKAQFLICLMIPVFAWGQNTQTPPPNTIPPVMPAATADAYATQVQQTITAANYYKAQVALLTKQLADKTASVTSLTAQVIDLTANLRAAQANPCTTPTTDQAYQLFITAHPEIPKIVADFLNSGIETYVFAGPVAR